MDKLLFLETLVDYANETFGVVATVEGIADSEFEDDLGIDSLDRIELFMWIDDVLDHNVPDDPGLLWNTVGEMIEWLVQENALTSAV